MFVGREEKHNKICECNSKHNEARETRTLILYVINVCTYQQNNWRNFLSQAVIEAEENPTTTDNSVAKQKKQSH